MRPSVVKNSNMPASLANAPCLHELWPSLSSPERTFRAQGMCKVRHAEDSTSNQFLNLKETAAWRHTVGPNNKILPKKIFIKIVKLTGYTLCLQQFDKLNMKCLLWPETETLLIWWNLPVKTREITLGKLIFSEFQPVGTVVWHRERLLRNKKGHTQLSYVFSCSGPSTLCS